MLHGVQVTLSVVPGERRGVPPRVRLLLSGQRAPPELLAKGWAQRLPVVHEASRPSTGRC